MISTLVVTSHKINACSVFAPQRMLRAPRVSMAPRLHDQLNPKDADARSSAGEMVYSLEVSALGACQVYSNMLC